MLIKPPAIPSLNAVATELAAGAAARLRFPRALEARFEADTGATRQVTLGRMMLVGLAAYAAFLPFDLTMLPDVVRLAVGIRLAVAPACLGLLLLTLRGRLSPQLRESCATLALLVATAGALLIFSCSRARDAAEYGHGIVLFIVFANTVVRLRFRFAVLFSAATLAMFALALWWGPLYSASTRINALLIAVPTAAFTLLANWQLERESRRTYLLTLHAALRGEDLAARNQALDALTRTDPLTGVGNRRALDRRLSDLWDSGVPVALVTVDIDHFKAFNDQYGHPAGDACLHRVAQVLRAELRGGPDLLARTGGEEFTAVLPDASGADALAVAERMRDAIARLGLQHLAAPAGRVTVSLGVAARGQELHGGWPALVGLADAALYAAKREGRDQVRVAGLETAVRAGMTAAVR